MERKRYAGVLVKSAGKVLLCKRSANKNSFPNMWSIPAGKIEDGEKTIDAAKREFFEETSLDIDDDNVTFIGILPVFNKKNGIKSMMYVYLLETEEQLKPNLDLAIDGHEHTDWGYFDLKEVESLSTGSHLQKLIKIFLNKS